MSWNGEMTALLLALVGAISYGVADFVGGVAARRVNAIRIVIVSYPVSAVVVLALAMVFGGDIQLDQMMWAAAAGIASGVAMWWFYRAMAIGPMSVVSPVTAVLVAGIPVIVGVVLGERPSWLAFVGIGVALVAVVMVSSAPGGHAAVVSAEAAWLTVGSGSAFGLAFVFMHQIGAGGGLWPLFAARVASTVVVIAVALAMREFAAPPRSVIGLALLAGLLEVTATGALMFAFQGSLLSLVSVIGALYPAATVALALVILRERLSKIQAAGLVAAAGAVGLIAAGG